MIETKFELGDHLFFARSRDVYDKDEKLFDGETWFRKTVVYVPYVREKVIVGVRLTIRDDSLKIDYELKNVEPPSIEFPETAIYLPWVISEKVLEEKAFKDPIDAMEAAEKAASEKRTLYD